MKTLKLAIVALTAVTALAGCSGSGDGNVDATTLQRVAQDVARGQDWVNPKQLAKWFIQGRKDFVLVDLRAPAAYAAGHIKDATNIPLAEVMNSRRLDGLPPGRKLIVYSTDSANAAAATALLRLTGRDVVGLRGGYEAWDREILHPAIPALATAHEAPATAEKRAMACYFVGGKGSAAEAPVYAPKAPPLPVTPPTEAPPPRPQQHNEGC